MHLLPIIAALVVVAIIVYMTIKMQKESAARATQQALDNYIRQQDIKAHPEKYYVSEGGLIPDPEQPVDSANSSNSNY